MDRAPVPDDVTRFVLISIPSVPYLEAMLLLRNNRTCRWNSKQVSQRLYMSDKAAAELLAQLHEAGIVEATAEDPPLFYYQPASDDLAQMIDRLAAAYARNLIGISNLIHSKTSKKAQQFVDAFKWGKEP